MTKHKCWMIKLIITLMLCAFIFSGCTLAICGPMAILAPNSVNQCVNDMKKLDHKIWKEKNNGDTKKE